MRAIRHILLRFNYAVEIGARLAYLGHYAVTKDPVIKEIADDELSHRTTVAHILQKYDKKPFFLFNWIFYAIGTVIRLACYVSPRFMLDFVASSMEAFAVINYRKLAKLYPINYRTLIFMAETEEEHRVYFKEKKWAKSQPLSEISSTPPQAQ